MTTLAFGERGIGGRSAEQWFEHGVACEKAERLADAAEAYRFAVDIRPHFAEAWFNLGNLLRDAGLLDGAENAFRAAVRHAPHLAAAWYNLADVQHERGDPAAAVGSLNRAVAADATFTDAWYNLGLCLDAAGRRRQARRAWERFLALEGHGPAAEAVRHRLSRP